MGAGASPALKPDSIIDWRESGIEAERLRAALLDAESRMLDAEGGGRKTAACLRCLQIALAEAKAKRLYVAWDNLHQFDIEYIATLDEEGRRVAWLELTAEADEKLKGWRSTAATALRKLLADASQAPSAQMVAALRKQLAMNAQNAHLKRQKLRDRVPLILIASLLAIVFCISTAFGGWYDSLFAEPLAWPLVMGVCAAVLGGLISVATSIGSADQQVKIPQYSFTLLLTTLRPVTGALCAIPVVFLVYGDFLTFAKLSHMGTSLVLCLLTGFSERWFLGVMDRVTAGAKG